MKKENVQALIGKGLVNINGVECRFDLSDKDFLAIRIPAINPYTEDRILGQPLPASMDEAWWADLEETIAVTHKKMLMQAEVVAQTPLELQYVGKGDRGKLYKCPETNREYATRRYEHHFEVILVPTSEEGYENRPRVNRPVKIDGIVYYPMWSWWMNTGYFGYKVGTAI